MNHYNSHPRARVGGDISINRPSLRERVLSALPPKVALTIQRAVHKGPMAIAHLPRRMWNSRRTLTRRHILNLPNVFVVLWIFVLLWGEKWVFQSSIDACDWSKWERWVGLFPRSSLEHLLIHYVAQKCHTSPPHTPRRPSDSRSTYIYRPSMAPLSPD